MGGGDREKSIRVSRLEVWGILDVYTTTRIEEEEKEKEEKGKSGG